MRLFRRKQEQDDVDTPDLEGPASGAPAASADDGVARPERQPTGDWMTLPPIAPSFSAMPTTFRVQTLPEILTSHADTRLSSSLGHAVSAEAPSGSIGGLATHAGDVSRTGGLGELPLREPHHAPHDEAAPAVEVRRLATPDATSSPEPTPLAAPSISTATPVVARLPEPAVSRSLLDTAPLAARPAPDRPLPVARVVDTSSPTSTSAPTTPPADPSPAGPTATSMPDDAPIPVEELVGGFGVGSEDLATSTAATAATEDDVPRISAPAELAPPIQPRRVQRRAEPAAASPPPAATADHAGGDAPLLGDPPATSPTSAAPAPTAPPAPPGVLPLVNRAGAATPGPAVDAPISRLADPGSPSTPAPAPPLAAPEPSAESPAAPLVGSTPMASPAPIEEPSSDVVPGVGDLPLHGPSATPPSIEPPIQRVVDTVAAASPPAPAGAPADDADASLVAGHASAREDEDTADLPLAPPPPEASAPTLGADPEPMVNVQPLAEGAGETHAAPSHGTGTLPLAPMDLGGALQPPMPPAAPAPDVPRSPDVRAVAPLASPAAPSSSRPVTAASLQRLDDRSTGSPTLPFVRPIGASSAGLGLQRSTATAGSTPMSTLGTASATAAAAELPVPMRRLGSEVAAPDPAESTSDGSAPHLVSVDHPLAPVQRLAPATPTTTPSTNGHATPSTNGHAAPDLPLHTPAASVPTAADVAVRAGLAERGPDGSLLYTTPPTTSIHVQRETMLDVAAAAGAPALGGAGAELPDAAVSEAVPAAGGRAAGKDGDRDPAATAKKLAEDARKLYPFIRSALEADIRRQLEGKSRASRFRP